MKLSGGLFLSALSLCAAAHSAPGRVFVYDPIDANAVASSSQSQPTVSPETARLILAQRLGVSQYHSIESVDDDLLRHLNAFGGKQELLGASSGEHTDAHLLVWLEGADKVEDMIRDPELYTSSFSIHDSPSRVYNDALISDLTKQAASLPARPLSQARMHEVILSESTLRPLGKVATYNDFLTVSRLDIDDANKAAIARALDTLIRASKSSITIVLTPSSASTSAIKPYGIYAMPTTLRARGQQPEKILSLGVAAPSTESAFSPIPNPADLEDFPVIQKTPSENFTRPLGILPPYFSTLRDCETATNGCSGHGACAELHKGAKNQRFVCVCEATRQHVGEDAGMEGKIKTTYWGGPACQKKDISMPFWLFVGSGVLLAGLISAGIGMLYSMGSEELPSVIGAGVSGPVRK